MPASWKDIVGISQGRGYSEISIYPRDFGNKSLRLNHPNIYFDRFDIRLERVFGLIQVLKRKRRKKICVEQYSINQCNNFVFLFLKDINYNNTIKYILSVFDLF